MHRWVDRLAARRFLANGSFVRQQTVVMVNDTMYPSPGVIEKVSAAQSPQSDFAFAMKLIHGSIDLVIQNSHPGYYVQCA